MNVDVKVMAVHGNDSVEIYLHLVGDAFFNGEEVRLMAVVPPKEFADGEEERDHDEDEGCVAAGGGASGVGWFRFGL